MHPRDVVQFGQRATRSPLQALSECVDISEMLECLHRKWYIILATPCTDDCGADDRICRLIADYACRAMSKGGVELVDARAFHADLCRILQAPITKCDLGALPHVEAKLDTGTKILSGQITLGCKKHDKLEWEFKIGKDVGAK